MLGMNFFEWMAVIGGWPTIFTTGATILLIVYAGGRAIYRHRDFKNCSYHIRETLRFEYQIKDLLSKTKPLTRWRFKRLIGEHAYTELTFVNHVPSKVDKSAERRRKKALKRLEKFK